MEYTVRKRFSFALTAIMALSPVVGSTAFAQTQVQISQSDIQTLLSSCAVGGVECAAALESLMTSVRAANPTLSVSAMAAAVAAEVAAAYNLGSVSPSVARAVFLSIESTPGVSQTLAAAVITSVSAIDEGQSIGIDAIADAGSAS
ncbi:MAG: hypothetical protein ACK446_02010 [Rhodobacterales bacterium]|jgi:hypothetical protein